MHLGLILRQICARILAMCKGWKLWLPYGINSCLYFFSSINKKSKRKAWMIALPIKTESNYHNYYCHQNVVPWMMSNRSHSSVHLYHRTSQNLWIEKQSLFIFFVDKSRRKKATLQIDHKLFTESTKRCRVKCVKTDWSLHLYTVEELWTRHNST